MAQLEYRKSDRIIVAPVSFRLPIDLKDGLDDLAWSQGVSVSSILIDFVEKLVEANKNHIENYRKLRATPSARIYWVQNNEDGEDKEFDEKDGGAD